MNLHEIEETLHTLIARHPGLDESMLVTLLRAGGWEERTIQEAVLMFRAGVTLPETTLPEVVDAEHMIPASFEAVQQEVVTPSPASVVEEQHTEPESLIVREEILELKEDLPHNLPLRPFETSDHIWPFSRYRDVFFGEQLPLQPPAPAVEQKTEVITNVIVPPSQPVQPVPVVHVVQTPPPAPFHVPVSQTEASHSHGDEKLVVMAAIMLLTVLLLLGYMYSNGRL